MRVCTAVDRCCWAERADEVGSGAEQPAGPVLRVREQLQGVKLARGLSGLHASGAPTLNSRLDQREGTGHNPSIDRPSHFQPWRRPDHGLSSDREVTLARPRRMGGDAS